MENYSFIPENNIRKTADPKVVSLFLKAILQKGYYETYPMVGVYDELTKNGTFKASSVSSLMNKDEEIVPVLDCDIEEAWRVLKEKGYHLRKDGSTFSVDKTKWATSSHRCGYYIF